MADNNEEVTAYPLCWPRGWPRTQYRQSSRYELDKGRSLDAITRALRLIGAKDVVVSTNVPVASRGAHKGMLLAGAPEPKDPGVAVYWTRKSRAGCMACDKYRTLRENLRAVAASLDALRAIERAGASQVLEQVFTGLRALPPNVKVQRPWRTVLGFGERSCPTRTECVTAYKELAHERHPDVNGGDSEPFVELQAAYEEALREVD